MLTSRRGSRLQLLLAAVGGAVAMAILLTGSAGAKQAATSDQRAVPPPAIPGVAPLPGPLAAPAQPASKLGILKTTPDVALPGTPFTVSGSGLPTNTALDFVWMTANVRYVLDARPDSVDFIGRQADKVGVVLGHATTDASGAFTLSLKAPRDYGGLHDTYVVANGVQLAKGGFLISKSIKMRPTRGPVGTPITLTVSGLGSSLYESGGAVLYDNHYAGAIAGNTTRGVATFQIRAAGPVGKHTVEVQPASHTVAYMNIEQSPVPWQAGKHFTFTVTKDAGPPAAKVDWPVSVTPTVNARTTLTAANATGVTAKLAPTEGTILSKVDLSAAGLAPSTPVLLQWTSIVGNRVNCTGTCWSFFSVPLGSAMTAADGSLKTTVTIPDTHGGWHIVEIVQGGQSKAQVPYFIERSVVGVTPTRLKAGQTFQIHLKGVGWTQLDNTVAVDYDNSFIGYGCGFNSGGDVVMNVVATGAPGTHLIDIYPLLYTQNPAYPYPPLGMVPLLTFAQDAPGLALGYRIPALRLAITVVK
jgi:hypothetical protein